MSGLQVGRSYKSAIFITPLVCVVVFLGLLLLSIVNKWGAEVFCGVLGGVSFLCLIAAAQYVRRGQRQLEITESGFCIDDIHGRYEYRDPDVTQIRYKSVVNYANGTANSITETVELCTNSKSGERWIPIKHQYKISERSQISQFIERLLKIIAASSRATLASGGKIQGENWSWSGDALTITEKSREPQVLNIADVTNVDVFDNHLCIWTGSDLPVVRLPEFTANMRLLWGLLEEKMPKRDGPSPGLGRVLFERKSSRWVVLFWGVCAALLYLGAIGIGISAAFARNPRMGIGAGIIFFISVLTHLCCAYFKRAYFRCHENGVSQRILISGNELRYDEIATFTCQMTRHYHNGAYIGTHVVLNFQPTQASGDKPIKYKNSVMNADEALDRLRGHISGIMARVLYKAYAAGTPIVWTKNLRLIPGEGIEFTPAGFFGRKPPVKYAWEDVQSFDLQKGFLHIWVKDQKKSVIQEACGAANFYPGLAVFSMLLERKGVAQQLEEVEKEQAA